MAKLDVTLYDHDTNLRYHLGFVEVQPKGTTTTFSAQFELSEQKFEVFATQVTQVKKTPEPQYEVYSYEINDRTNKAKKPKKSARKN